MVEETGHPCGDVVTGEGDFDVRQPPDPFEPGPYVGIGEDVQQQVGMPQWGVAIEGRLCDHGRHLQHGLVVAQHPAQHRLHRAGEPVPAAGRPGLGRAGGRRGSGAQRQQEGQAYGRVCLGVPPFQQRVVVREQEGGPPDARRGVR
ncbi:hypothetical protein [Streptomyces sp. NPDC001621]|uniref:hypothetical protein n=1 Tax=Streptomyces sp. NPDC001621 TaxID=3364594 RepID=UPI00368072A1